MPEFSLARTFRNRGLLLQTGSQFSNSAALLTGFADVTVMLTGTSVGTWIVCTFFHNLVMVADFLGNRRRIFSENFSDFFELEIITK